MNSNHVHMTFVAHTLRGAISDHQTALKVVEALASSMDEPASQTTPPPRAPRRRRGEVSEAVLCLLSAQGRAMSVAELHEKIPKTDDGGLGRASVARAMDWLLRRGAVRRAGASEWGALYSAVETPTPAAG